MNDIIEFYPEKIKVQCMDCDFNEIVQIFRDLHGTKYWNHACPKYHLKDHELFYRTTLY